MEHHHHTHFHFHADPGQMETLAAIREVKDLAMNLNDTLATLTSDDKELAADVVSLVSIINDIPNRIQAAVASSLANAGVSDEHTRAALNAVDITVKDAIAAAKSALPLSPAPAVDPSGSNTVGAGPADDTLTGGQGNDTVTGNDTATNPAAGITGNDGLSGDTGLTQPGNDTTTATVGNDTVASGGGSVPPASDATSATTDPTTGAVEPPPSTAPAV